MSASGELQFPCLVIFSKLQFETEKDKRTPHLECFFHTVPDHLRTFPVAQDAHWSLVSKPHKKLGPWLTAFYF
jgi:hypothetical protein